MALIKALHVQRKGAANKPVVSNPITAEIGLIRIANRQKTVDSSEESWYEKSFERLLEPTSF